MKKSVKLFLSVFVIVLLACSLVLTGCAISSEKHVCVVSIEQTGTNGLEDVYTVTYSDGSVSTFTITNGQDAKTERTATMLRFKTSTNSISKRQIRTKSPFRSSCRNTLPSPTKRRRWQYRKICCPS